jgi:hypothetical protein
MKAQFRLLLNSALDEGERSASCSDRFTFGKEASVISFVPLGNGISIRLLSRVSEWVILPISEELSLSLHPNRAVVTQEI